LASHQGSCQQSWIYCFWQGQPEQERVRELRMELLQLRGTSCSKDPPLLKRTTAGKAQQHYIEDEDCLQVQF